jgi:hypothetical protein
MGEVRCYLYPVHNSQGKNVIMWIVMSSNII